MATAPVTTEQSRKPKLEVCGERLANCASQLAEASDLYQRMKGALDQARQDPEQITTTELRLKLCIGDELEAPVPMPEDPQQRIAYIEEGTAFLGENVIRLWHHALEIATEGVRHCDAATAAAAAAAGAAQQPSQPQVAQQQPQAAQQPRQPQQPQQPPAAPRPAAAQ